MRIAQLEQELRWAQLRIQVLEERLRQQRIRMLGPGSETLSDLQLELLAEEEPGASADEVAAESRREPITTTGMDRPASTWTSAVPPSASEPPTMSPVATSSESP